MASLAEEAQFWAAKAADAHHNMLDTIQSSAGKWQAAIAAFLGLYATAGFLLTPDKLASLPVHGSVEAGLLAVFGAAGACGIAAFVLANLAAQGIPEILTGEPITGQRMRQLSAGRAIRSRGQLGLAIKLAAAAGLLIIASSVFLVVAGMRALDRPDAMVTGPRGAYCGELVNRGGVLILRLPSGQMIRTAGTSVTPVSSCPR